MNSDDDVLDGAILAQRVMLQFAQKCALSNDLEQSEMFLKRAAEQHNKLVLINKKLAISLMLSETARLEKKPLLKGSKKRRKKFSVESCP